MPTWASTLALQLHMDALTLHMIVLTMNLNHLSPLNHKSHLKKIRHVHAHHLRQVEESRCLHVIVEVHARHFPRIGHYTQ